MTIPEQQPNLTDLVDGTLAGPEWEAWLARHTQAAAQVAEARQVRALVAQLREVGYAVPADLEARILDRVHRDAVFRELFQLNLAGIGSALLELLAVLFSFLPASDDASRVARNA